MTEEARSLHEVFKDLDMCWLEPISESASSSADAPGIPGFVVVQRLRNYAGSRFNSDGWDAELVERLPDAAATFASDS